MDNDHDVEVAQYDEPDDSQLCYTIRLDSVDHDRVHEFFKKYKTDYKKFWIFDEIADVTGKQHVQGVIVFHRIIEKKEEIKHRNRISSFFSRKGSQFSFQKVKDYENYLVYIVKGGKPVICEGYSNDDYTYYKTKQENLVKKIAADKVKREKAKGVKKPMELLWEYYEPLFLQEFERYKKKQVDENYDYSKFLSKDFDLARHVARCVVIYWGEMAHKSFMINKIVEASDYICFRVYRKYSQSEFEQVMQVNVNNIVERMTFAKI